MDGDRRSLVKIRMMNSQFIGPGSALLATFRQPLPVKTFLGAFLERELIICYNNGKVKRCKTGKKVSDKKAS